MVRYHSPKDSQTFDPNWLTNKNSRAKAPLEVREKVMSDIALAVVKQLGSGE
ncbi:MAG: hypothetical protein DSM106950_21460 [Stigonema ocellatum SAG 48.90 = DSM 106950]|nr:hypothetical protein [Stigonema ocellatum SAG 48.90 = DSM 106950]